MRHQNFVASTRAIEDLRVIRRSSTCFVRLITHRFAMCLSGSIFYTLSTHDDGQSICSPSHSCSIGPAVIVPRFVNFVILFDLEPLISRDVNLLVNVFDFSAQYLHHPQAPLYGGIT